MKTWIANDEDWLEARRTLLQKEKDLTRLRDELTRARRAMPWRRLSQNYEFEGPNGKLAMKDLFGDRSQLIIYHFMYGPGWEEGCKSCSFWADHYDAVDLHLGARDVAFAVVSRAPWQEFVGFKRRMGWQFTWVSSTGSTFNEDFHVSFPDKEHGFYNYRETGVMEELPGLSVFAKDDDGVIYHTYSAYSRGLDALNATYQMLDLVPKGRDEDDLEYPMSWVRLHDRY